jgi:hypothetical protein
MMSFDGYGSGDGTRSTDERFQVWMMSRVIHDPEEIVGPPFASR